MNSLPLFLSVVCAVVLGAVSASAAEDSPSAGQSFPPTAKASLPDPLPDPPCDTTLPSDGGWLAGRWVAPYAQFSFEHSASGWTFSFTQKAGFTEGNRQDGTHFSGPLTSVNSCQFKGTTGTSEHPLVFEGVLTERGQVYATLTNDQGASRRYVLRRER